MARAYTDFLRSGYTGSAYSFVAGYTDSAAILAQQINTFYAGKSGALSPQDQEALYKIVQPYMSMDANKTTQFYKDISSAYTTLEAEITSYKQNQAFLGEYRGRDDLLPINRAYLNDMQKKSNESLSAFNKVLSQKLFGSKNVQSIPIELQEKYLIHVLKRIQQQEFDISNFLLSNKELLKLIIKNITDGERLEVIPEVIAEMSKVLAILNSSKRQPQLAGMWANDLRDLKWFNIEKQFAGFKTNEINESNFGKFKDFIKNVMDYYHAYGINTPNLVEEYAVYALSQIKKSDSDKAYFPELLVTLNDILSVALSRA